MAERRKQIILGITATVSAISILTAIVIWIMARKPPTEQLPAEYHPSEHQPTSHQQPAIGMNLNKIIKAAETWRPAFQSWYGQMAPDFTLTDINGKQHKLSDYQGRNVLIIFWATWCGPCIMEIPHLIELRNTISEDKLAILAISREDLDSLKKFATRQKINYTILLERGYMAKPYSLVKAIPSSFFINPDGKIKLATQGILSSDEIKAILQAQ